MKYRHMLCIAALVSGISPASADAASIFRNFSINASDFVFDYGPTSPPPKEDVFLHFTVAFHNTLDINATSDALTVNSFNLPSSVQYAYNKEFDQFIIATNPFINGCALPANSFCGVIDKVSSLNPSLRFFEQVTTAGGIATSRKFSFHVTEAGVVPEPATWLMIIAGFGMVGAAVRRKKLGRGLSSWPEFAGAFA